jgi:hypothetical protein
LLLAILVAVLYLPTLSQHAIRTFDPFTFNDDARILIWPFFRDADPGLFPGDPFITYFLGGLPEGYRALYHVLGRLGLAERGSEVIPYLLLCVTLVFILSTAKRLGGLRGAWISAVLLLGGVSVMDRLGGGLPRAFAFPLVAAGAYALVSGQARMLAFLAVLGAMFYPVVAALLGLSLFFLLVFPSQLRGTTEETPWKHRALLLALTFVCIAALLLPTMLRMKPYGATITPAMLADYPEAGPGGRLGPEQQAPFPPVYKSAGFHAKQALLGQGALFLGRYGQPLRSTETRINCLVGGVLLAALLTFTAKSIRMRRLPPEAIRLSALLLAMVVGYILAAWVTPTLFLPERYTQYTAPILAILAVAMGFGSFPRVAGESSLLLSPRSSQFINAVSWLISVIVLVLLGGRGTSWTGIEVFVPPEERQLYAELERLPKDVLIAGWPVGPLENVPYLSKRRVLTNYQLEMPFHRQFTEATRKRLKGLFAAYFATNDESLRQLHTEFYVTHLVVDPALFSDPMPTYYRPFDVDVWQRYLAARAQPRLLEVAKNPNFGRKIGRFYLVDLKAFAH